MAQENIESTLHEDRQFAPSQAFVSTATVNARQLDELYAKAAQDHEGFWAELAHQQIDWQTPFTQTLDSSNAPHFRWFPDGKLNVSYNCLDRQLEKKCR
jgi:acetyl-CoA synthetase